MIVVEKATFFTQCQPSKVENDTASDVYNYLNENKHDWGIREGFNSLPDDNFFIIPNWKHFPDNKMVVDQIMGYTSIMVENHVELISTMVVENLKKNLSVRKYDY